ncbi:hypothetical protein AOC36_05545 [Erysipelothrix larvae]|uniref:Uncharacterized protein n=1 Tax=Erysipelothrix larvae TaxID=1514105 RepID=A0A0X8GZS6_9FIRM|nr:hypothetical protein [Erysipelothrix larvae]AMC93460.1 hypothetical protein AOC36_05545 [Erysipelothrix larvae]
MKKVLITVLLAMVILLTGCQVQSIESVIQSTLSSPLPSTTNHSKPMFRYYVPSTVGVKSSSQNSTLLNINGYDVLMNLSISQIISSEYYEADDAIPALNLENFEVMFQYTGAYYDAQSVSRNFHVDIIRLRDNTVSIILNNQLVDIIAVVSDTSLNLTLEHMITIMRSVDVDNDLVVATYSTKEIIDRDAIFSEFFEQVPPENGSLQDMYDRLNPDRNQDTDDSNDQRAD